MTNPLVEVSRFASLLTTNPSTEELLLTVVRDFASSENVVALEVSIIGLNENMELRHHVGSPIDGPESKTILTLSDLLKSDHLVSEVSQSGYVYAEENHVTATAISIDSSVKGFYLFQHNTRYAPSLSSGHYLQALSSLITIYLLGKFPRGTTTSFLGAEIKTESVLRLSARQLLIVAGMIDGKTNHDLAISLGFSVSTIRHETMAIYKELGVSDRNEAAKVALANSLI